MKEFRLDGRRVLLTGAAGHLGASIAKSVAAAGAHVVLAGRTEQRLRDLSEAINSVEQRTASSVLPVDLTSEAERQIAAERLSNNREGLAGIINNAYSGRPGGIAESRPGDFLAACQLNLVAPFELTRLLVGVLSATAAEVPGGSSVVNVASMYGVVSPDPRVYTDPQSGNPPHYGATKGGLIQLSRYLACHLAPERIRVNSVSPGAFPSDFVQEGNPGLIELLSERIPLGRPGRPREVAGPIVFLLSSASSYITGANLPIDGGWTAW